MPAACPSTRRRRSLLQLDGSDGAMTLVNEAEGYRAHLTWDAATLPSVLLWYSNRGRRRAAPWNGRHLCIGIEPLASPFGLSRETARADNPVARAGTPTTVALTPGAPCTIAYRIEIGPA